MLVAFSVLYAAVGLIGASEKLPDWALFAPWITLLGLQHFIIRGLAGAHPVGAIRAEELSPNGGSIFPAPPHDSKLPLGHPVSTSSVSSRPPRFTVRSAPRI